MTNIFLIKLLIYKSTVSTYLDQTGFSQMKLKLLQHEAPCHPTVGLQVLECRELLGNSAEVTSWNNLHILSITPF